MTPEAMSSLRLDAGRCAGHLRLGLRERNWQGTQGNWAGAGIGSSIDFQDHRPYLPGDDPRYIDWAAYARSGQTIMKLYREEVSPRMDLVLDLSRSMFYQEGKAAQTLRLFFFCMESALAISASLRVYTVSGEQVESPSLEQLADPSWNPDTENASPGIPALERIPFRQNAMRLLISDLLYDTPPDPLLTVLAAQKGRGGILVPYLEREQQPDWAGNMEFLDCERGRYRRQRVDTGLLKNYRTAYERHFQSWRDGSLRYRVRFARVPCACSLSAGLETEALPAGVVETWG